MAARMLPTLDDRSHLRSALFGALVVGALDLVTKVATVRWLADEPLDLGFVTLTYHRNPGIAFSLGNTLPTPVLLVLTSAAVVAIGVATWRGVLRPGLAAGFMFGGGLANLLDRAFTGSVVDMIDLGWWPTFNVADIALNVGVVLVLWYSLTSRELGAADWSDAVSAMDRATATPTRRPVAATPAPDEAPAGGVEPAP